MEEHDSEAVPEDIEHVVRQTVERVIGALDGFKDFYRGTIEFRRALLTLPEDEVKKMLPEPVADAVRSLDENEVLEAIQNIESAIDFLEQLKSPSNLETFKIASSDLMGAIGTIAVGIMKLRRFLEGGSTL